MPECRDCLSWVEEPDVHGFGECDCPYAEHYGDLLAASHPACDWHLTDQDLDDAATDGYDEC
jgi:hypothetical protein